MTGMRTWEKPCFAPLTNKLIASLPYGFDAATIIIQASCKEVELTMLNLEKAKKSPNLFRRLTGISLQEFDELMAVLKKAYPDYERRGCQEGKGKG